MSHQKFKGIKSKLPIITSQHSFNSTHSAFHSHGKLTKISDALADFEHNIRALREGLDVFYANLGNKRLVFHPKGWTSRQA
jgi:hypothetical protein